MASPRAVVGGWPGSGAEAWLGEQPAADPVDHHRIGLGARFGIDHDHALALGREVLVAPREEGPEHGQEVAPALGQNIFVARRMRAVAAALEQTCLDQRIEPPGPDCVAAQPA